MNVIYVGVVHVIVILFGITMKTIVETIERVEIGMMAVLIGFTGIG